MTKERFRLLWEEGKKKRNGMCGSRGFLNMVIVIATVEFLMFDLFHHNILLYVSNEVTMLTFGVSNPVNGNTIRITNHGIADSTYYFSLFFICKIIWRTFRTHVGSTTLSVKTRFIIER